MNQSKDEQEKIEEFLHFLDQHGYNFWVLNGIRSLLRQPYVKGSRFIEDNQETSCDHAFQDSMNDKEQEEKIDPNDFNTGEVISGG